jgi:hypothetical protein
MVDSASRQPIGGIHLSREMILPRFLELKERHRKKLERGEVTTKPLIAVAGTRFHGISILYYHYKSKR